jgi:uracil phosphoribosyltransferase
MSETARRAPSRPPNVREVEHALVAADLALLRSADTPRTEFRRLVARIATLVVAEATRRLPTRPVEVRTPLEATAGRALARPVVLVPVLRAGLGMLDAALALLPEASVGHLGVYRDERTREPVPYYKKLPPETATATALVLDPMLATGGTACHAIDVVKATGCPEVIVAAIVAAPEGLARVAERHADVLVHVAVLDRCLDARGFIRPGLGDAGDRIFGTVSPP